MPTFTPPPDEPLRTDAPSSFISKAFAFIGWFRTMVSEFNAFAASLTLVSTTDTSASSVAIGAGAKTFTVSAGKSFSAGMYLVIADTAAPTTNSMFCQVSSYSGTTLIVNAISVLGSGTKTAWTISLSAGATILGDGSVTTNKVADGAMTYAKLQNISATKRVLGRNTAGAGVGEEVSITQLLDWVGTVARGDILYRNATTWVRLAAGTLGQFLKTNGAGADPAWANIPTQVIAGTYLSPAQTITSGGALTLAHGLGAKPLLIQPYIKNTTTEAGYAVGDEIFIASFFDNGSTLFGMSVVPDATNLNIRFSNAGNFMIAPHKTTGARTLLTNANWQLYIRAYV